jgi:hypothetical protein
MLEVDKITWGSFSKKKFSAGKRSGHLFLAGVENSDFD